MLWIWNFCVIMGGKELKLRLLFSIPFGCMRLVFLVEFMAKCKTVVLGGFMAVDLLRGKSVGDISNIGKDTVINKKKRGKKNYKVRSSLWWGATRRNVLFSSVVSLNKRDFFMKYFMNCDTIEIRVVTRNGVNPTDRK